VVPCESGPAEKYLFANLAFGAFRFAPIGAGVGRRPIVFPMKKIFFAFIVLAWAAGSRAEPAVATRHTITVKGTHFLVNGEPFPFTGYSFFNAVFNPTFNRSPESRREWLARFQKYKINVLRVWCQWAGRPYVDASPESIVYNPDGTLRAHHLATLKAILHEADEAGMVIELVLFAHESWFAGIRLDRAASERAVAALTRELLPYRNVTFQIWNELSERVLDYVKIVRANDPARLITNAPGNAGDLGDQAQNDAVDYLTPHTTRQRARHWEIVPREIAYLIATYKKPVVDDEPARNGTAKYGGPKGATSPYDQIVQIYGVWQAGGYVNYHHDMFQTNYGAPEVPPSGIPDPEFNPYHRQVLEFIALRDRYAPADIGPTKKP